MNCLLPRPGLHALFLQHGRTTSGCRRIADAHKNDGRWYIGESDELLTAFLKLESTLW
jgi:hypothetical protein